MDALLRRWAIPLQHAAPSIVSLLLIMMLAWLLAELTWALVPQKQSNSTGVMTAPVTGGRQVDAVEIANRHLFGMATPSTTQNAPDTTLALTLHGIVSGRGVADSRALILANGDEEPYSVGAQLPGGAVIRAIYPDRVMLERDGRVEALRLPKSDSGGGNTMTSTGPSPPMGMPPPMPQNLGQLRQAIANNPERLMDSVRAMPVMQQNKLTGYRIYPAGNPAIFNQLGLKPGDVVTAVNGIPLTDPAQSMRILSSVKTSQQVSVTLLRNGQPQTQVLQMQDQSPQAPDQPPNQNQDQNPDQNQDQEPP
jgi:general secretion pathway protein C